MSITVKQLSDNFSYLKESDFKYLTGKSSNIQDDDTVSLSKLASLNKQDINIFAAKKEGTPFLGQLQGERRVDAAKMAKVKDDKNVTNPFAQKDEHQRSSALGAWIPPERKAWVG